MCEGFNNLLGSHGALFKNLKEFCQFQWQTYAKNALLP